MIELLRDGPWRKLLWADKHFTKLVEARDTNFGGEWPIKHVHTAEQDEHGVWWDVQRYASTPDLSPDLALIAGDAMHNLRSALDHLVGALALLNSRSVTGQHEFPMWTNKPTGKALTQTLRREKLRGLHPDDRRAIEDLLPYNTLSSPRTKLLLALHQFDVVDKHRFVPPAATAERDPQLFVRGEGVKDHQFRFTEGRIEAGREQMRVRTDTKAPVGFRTIIDLEFGDPPIALNTMILIQDAVREVLAGFEVTFSNPRRDHRV